MRPWGGRPIAKRTGAVIGRVSGSAGTDRPHGQALVEFALTMMVLGMLLVGVADFARAFYFDVVVSGAANEGARVSAGGGSNDTVRTAAQASAPSGLICNSCV